jgi:hypothetical protein
MELADYGKSDMLIGKQCLSFIRTGSDFTAEGSEIGFVSFNFVQYFLKQILNRVS